MKANRFIIHNPTIESYQLEEYYNYFKRIEEIDKDNINIYKTIEQNQSATNSRFQLLQYTSKFNKQKQQNAQDKLQKLFLFLKLIIYWMTKSKESKQEKIHMNLSNDIKSSKNTFNSSLENINLIKKLQTLKPNISKKNLDIHYEKQREYGNRLRKLPKLPDFDQKSHYLF
ncbi:unnamed protein product (macronuclear) [Paramecium tetraurelia]|uniref:Transmembrane protein n=1 Tax=Paramecium tetraurelia TaxID=5888 RepID=A0BAP6_PARTE|nr:uncharacterized protein GSPATT00000048001 [Paramecium tetraurelia]CAK55613.1 unnamed protein product [Paramecium tetraurelia]|eukprot:XP_001423011.1 hypothetical protein (macronuclear) [Paramecium tetraurelia strain d4-2]